MNNEKLYKKIMFKDIEFSNMIDIPSSCKDLIVKMLDKNQKKRITISQIKNHQFFRGYNLENLPNKKMIPPVIPKYKKENINNVKK
jgi:serine/threonine protein kinase